MFTLLFQIFLLLPDSAPADAFQAADRIRPLQEVHVREARNAVRPAATPRRKLQRTLIPKEMSPEERARFLAAVKRFAAEEHPAVILRPLNDQEQR